MLDAKAAAELRPASEARAPPAPARHRPRRGRAAGDTLRLRPARLRRLRPAPAAARSSARRCSGSSCPAPGPLRFADHIAERGEDCSRPAGALGLEGVVGKKADSPYRGGALRRLAQGAARPDAATSPSSATPSREGRAVGFGALHLASWQDGGLVYAGRVGTGFSEKQLAELYGRLSKRRALDSRRAAAPSDGPRPRLGRARAGRRGALQGVDRRRPPAPAGVPALPRRQADRGVRPRGRSGSRGARSPLRRSRTRPRPRRSSPKRRSFRSPTSTRSSGPRRATPRAISSSTTARSRPGCCPT